MSARAAKFEAERERIAGKLAREEITPRQHRKLEGAIDRAEQRAKAPVKTMRRKNVRRWPRATPQAGV